MECCGNQVCNIGVNICYNLVIEKLSMVIYLIFLPCR